MSESNDEKENSVDCYAAGDRQFMEWGQRLRAQLLAPLLSVLLYFGVTANHLTIISLAFGLCFLPLFFLHRELAFLSLLLHIVFDGIDGPLARARGTASSRGSFTDTACDQVVVFVTTATFIEADLLSNHAGLIYVFAYTVVVGFSMVRNALAIPYSWLVRPRFLVYLAAAVEWYLFAGVLSVVVWICNALLVWKVVSGFANIRKSL